jgi:predicted membrane protein
MLIFKRSRENIIFIDTTIGKIAILSLLLLFLYLILIVVLGPWHNFGRILDKILYPKISSLLLFAMLTAFLLLGMIKRVEFNLISEKIIIENYFIWGGAAETIHDLQKLDAIEIRRNRLLKFFFSPYLKIGNHSIPITCHPTWGRNKLAEIKEISDILEAPCVI